MKSRAEAVLDFYDRVCKKAEGNMLKTGKLEGSHFAAMRSEIEAIRNKLEKEWGDERL